MEFFDSSKKPIDIDGFGCSVTVLIDIDGERDDFDKGWYDFDTKVWRIDSSGKDDVPQKKAKKLLWSYMPLKELDGIKL